MAQQYLFFNAQEIAPDVFDREYQASDFAEYFGSVLSTGLLHTDDIPGMHVSVEQGTLNTVVSDGKAIMKGHLYKNTTPFTLNHSIPEATADRIDRIVLRLDLRNAQRNILLHVKEGVPSDEPVAPELQRDNFIHELSLAQVRIKANTSSIDKSDLIDERLDEALCGLTYSLISIPTNELVNQFNQWMDEFTSTKQADFEAWLEYLEGVLDENTAGNLLNLIEQNKTSIQDAIRIKQNVTLLSDDWIDGENYYEYHLNDPDIDGSCVVDVAIHKESLLDAAYLLPVTESYAGGFILCSSKAPSEDIVIDYRITREAE